MPKRPRLSLDKQIRLGQAVLRARAKKIPWKVLSREYGFCKARLWQFANLAAEAAEKSVYKHNSAGQDEDLGDRVISLRRRAAG